MFKIHYHDDVTIYRRCIIVYLSTSLEDLGAATCKLVNFVDHKVQSPFEVLQKSSTVVGSVTDRQIDRHTNIWSYRADVAAKNFYYGQVLIICQGDTDVENLFFQYFSGSMWAGSLMEI